MLVFLIVYSTIFFFLRTNHTFNVHILMDSDDELVDQNFSGRPCAVIGAHHASPVAWRSLYIMPQARAGSKIGSPRWRTAATASDRRALSANGSDRSLAGPHPHVAGSTETTWKVCMWPSSPRIETYSPWRNAWLPKR